MSAPIGDLAGIDLMRDLVARKGADSVRALMRLTTTTANAAVRGSAHAGITVPNVDRWTTQAATDTVARAVDELQHRHGGPSLDSLTGDAPVVHTSDLCSEDRWSGFPAAVVAETAVRSMMSFRLSVGAADPVGALTLYADVPRAFDVTSIEVGRRLADYCAAVLAHARELDRADGLQQAVTSNRDIGAAVGILMAQQRITRERAFELLRNASQHANRAVRDIADIVVRTGTLPVRGSE